MKIICVTLVLMFLFLVTFSENIISGKEAAKVIPGTEILKFNDKSSIPEYIKFSIGNEISFNEMNKWMNRFFKNHPGNYLVYKSKTIDKKGSSHYKYQQFYKGIPVENTVWIVHVKKDKIYSMNGSLFKLNLPVLSAVSEEQALIAALKYSPAEKYKWQVPAEENQLKLVTGKQDATWFPTGSKVIMANGKNQFSLVWKFDIYAQKPLKRSWIYIDATTGLFAGMNDRIHIADVTGTAVTKYSGTQTITTDSYSGSYRLRETGRGLGVETYDLNMGSDYGAAADFTDTDNNWNNVNPEQDEVATDAHWATEKVYDYYWFKFGRNSLDDAGFKLVSYVHADLVAMGLGSNVNAFWDGTSMTYGDGDGTYSPLTTVDICGHEVTHGVVENTAGLVYAQESGALNEGYADVFGTCVEFYGKPTMANYTIGEDIGAAFRVMSDPNSVGDPDTYQGNYWDPGGEVHKNGTVFSYWFYLLAEGGSGTNDISDNYVVTGITRDTAAAIIYHALVNYLTPDATYSDARYYTILSAIDLYGTCSPEVESVTNAWYAVGVGIPYVAGVVADFEAAFTQFCTAPSTVNFTNLSSNGLTFLWNFGDGGTSTALNPTHIYNSFGSFNVTLITDGGACGKDTIIMNAYISLSTSNPCNVVLPTNGTISQNSCTGTLFDSGGQGNYQDETDATVTIAPSGATAITLNFVSFAFEQDFDFLYIYDGPTTGSLQVAGSPFTGLASPGTITTSGGSVTIRQTSDQAQVASGFEMTWICSMPSSPPVSNLSVSETTSCNGMISFFDASLNNPFSWNWDFGDGTSSTLADPIHTYNSSGVYTVTLITTNNYGSDTLVMTDYITIDLLSSPVTVNDTVCQNESAILTATGAGDMIWYESPVGSSPIFSGSPYTTPLLTSTTIYYVLDSVYHSNLYVGETNNTSNGDIFTANAQHYLVFDCFAPCILVSVEVNASGDGNRTFSLMTSTGALIDAVTVFVPDGVSRINLNLNIPVGTNLRLAGQTSPDLFRSNTGLSYPYTLPGLISIKYSSASTDPTGYYYFCYDWEVLEPTCNSGRTPVTAVVETCSNVDEISSGAGTMIYPNPANQTLNVVFSSAENFKGMEIINIHGQLVKTIGSEVFASSGENVIDISDLSAGVYYCRMNYLSGSVIQKLIIVR